MRRRNISIIISLNLFLLSSCVNDKNDYFRMRQRPILYLVTDPRTFTSEDFLNHIEKVIKGGVDVVQLRDKKASDPIFLKTAKALLKITTRYKVPLVINDRVQISKQIACAGVHVGQSDWRGSKKLRMGIKGDQIIGFSIENEQQLNTSPSNVDYIGVGPIFSTKTKSDAAPCIGLKGLKNIREKTNLPIIAIGGIKESNIVAVIHSGADGVAVVGELMDAKDPENHARYLKNILMKAHATSGKIKLL